MFPKELDQQHTKIEIIPYCTLISYWVWDKMLIFPRHNQFIFNALQLVDGGFSGDHGGGFSGGHGGGFSSGGGFSG